MSADKLARNMRMINGLLAVFSGLAAVVAFISISGVESIFMAFYCVFFSVLLLLFELRLSSLDDTIRTNFGFMFSYWGRAFFIVFMGTLCCALDTILGYIAGSLMFINALFNAYVIYT
eukprot:g5740.t1